jgi:hypothetical protein
VNSSAQTGRPGYPAQRCCFRCDSEKPNHNLTQIPQGLRFPRCSGLVFPSLGMVSSQKKKSSCAVFFPETTTAGPKPSVPCLHVGQENAWLTACYPQPAQHFKCHASTSIYLHLVTKPVLSCGLGPSAKSGFGSSNAPLKHQVWEQGMEKTCHHNKCTASWDLGPFGKVTVFASPIIHSKTSSESVETAKAPSD